MCGRCFLDAPFSPRLRAPAGPRDAAVQVEPGARFAPRRPLPTPFLPVLNTYCVAAHGLPRPRGHVSRPLSGPGARPAARQPRPLAHFLLPQIPRPHAGAAALPPPCLCPRRFHHHPALLRLRCRCRGQSAAQHLRAAWYAAFLSVRDHPQWCMSRSHMASRDVMVEVRLHHCLGRPRRTHRVHPACAGGGVVWPAPAALGRALGHVAVVGRAARAVRRRRGRCRHGGDGTVVVVHTAGASKHG